MAYISVEIVDVLLENRQFFYQQCLPSIVIYKTHTDCVFIKPNIFPLRTLMLNCTKLDFESGIVGRPNPWPNHFARSNQWFDLILITKPLLNFHYIGQILQESDFTHPISDLMMHLKTSPLSETFNNIHFLNVFFVLAVV